MKEIFFRAWDIKRKLMSRPYMPFGQCLVFSDDDSFYPEAIEPADYIFMQFTGLQDKNGVDIVEEDVCDNDGVKHKVIFHNGFFGLENGKLFSPLFFYPNIKVIGNIYENPKLLKD